VCAVGKMLDSRQNDTCAIHNNRRGLLSNIVFLPHNKARPPRHVCSNTENSKPFQTVLTYLPKALFPTQRQSTGIHQGTKVLPSCRDLIEADTHCFCNSINSNTNSHTYNTDSKHTVLTFNRLANHIATVIQLIRKVNTLYGTTV
jgi:hypothetical protein